MKEYSIEIAISARIDMAETARWMRDEISPSAAEKWLARLHKTILSLRRQPLRCPLADENDRFLEEIRVLVHGKHPSKFRIVFTIREDAVVILYVRHGARDELRP